MLSKRRRSAEEAAAAAPASPAIGASLAAAARLSPRSPNVAQQLAARGKRRCYTKPAPAIGAEAAAASKAAAAFAAAAAPFALGTRVVLVGLTSTTNPYQAKELNGRAGAVEGFDAQRGLYSVNLIPNGPKVTLKPSQCQRVPEFAQQPGAAAAGTTPAVAPAASASPAAAAAAGVPPGIDPGLYIRILSELPQDERSKVIRVCSDFMGNNNAAAAAAAAAAASSPAPSAQQQAVPAGTPNLAEMTPASPAPSAAPTAFPTPGLVSMATGSARKQRPAPLKRAGELKQRGDKAAGKSKQARRQEQAKRQKQQRHETQKAKREATTNAAAAVPAQLPRTLSDTPATMHEHPLQAAVYAAAAAAPAQGSVPTPAMLDPTHAAAAPLFSPRVLQQAAPTPVLPGDAQQAAAPTEHPASAAPVAAAAAAAPAALPIDHMKRVLERARSKPEDYPSVNRSTAAAATTAAAGTSPTPVASTAATVGGASATAGGATDHTAPTPIGAADAAPTPSSSNGNAAEQQAPTPARHLRSVRTSQVPTGETAPPTPNTAAAKTAEDTAREAAVRASKKAASKERAEKELTKKQDERISKLKKDRDDAASVAVDKQRVSAAVEQELAQTHRSMRFTDILRFYCTAADGRRATRVPEILSEGNLPVVEKVYKLLIAKFHPDKQINKSLEEAVRAEEVYKLLQNKKAEWCVSSAHMQLATALRYQRMLSDIYTRLSSGRLCRC